MNQDLQSLIESCKRRDRKAQKRFYEAYFGFLYATCRRYVNDREEIIAMLNLGFAKIMLNFDKYDGVRSFESWIKSVMINVVIDEFRKTRKYKETIQVEMDMSKVKRIHDHSTDELNEDLIEAARLKLSELPEITRNVFNLYVVDGYKHKEIAEMLGIPEGTCHWHYHNARQALREHFSSEYGIQIKKATG